MPNAKVLSEKQAIVAALSETLKVAFKGGSVMGLCVVGLGLVGLIFLIQFISKSTRKKAIQ